MLYLSYVPVAPLNVFVERMWLVLGGQSARRDRILPNGTTELVINLLQDRISIARTDRCPRARTFSGAVVSGPYSAAFVIDAMQHAAMIGVHFKSAGACAVLGIPANEFSDTHVDLDTLWTPDKVNELRERLSAARTHRARFMLLERVLTERLLSSRCLHPAVPLALECFHGDGCGASVRDVTRLSGLSHRRFLSIFTSQVGLPPKTFCRILRFQHAHAIARRTGHLDWTDLALTCGFYDQAHLTNEFRKLSGLTPTEYEWAIQETHHLLRGHVAIR